MQIKVEVERPSSIVRKMKIRVPAQEVKSHFEKGLVAVQKTAKLKGFRPGHAPLSIIKQFYGEDVKHRVFHNLIDESFQEAVREQKLKTVGSPKIETPEHKTGEGEHDHGLQDGADLTFTATVEVMPEIQPKGYTGIGLTREKVEIDDEQVGKVIENLRNSYAELIPAAGGLTLADGSQSSRPVQKGDYVDIQFSGGVVNENVIQDREDMKGSRVIEVGSGSFIPGFEEELVGIRRGETKTFRTTFPAEFSVADLAGKQAEFTVTVNEVKEKKLPVLDDEFAKQSGHEDLKDLHVKAREYLLQERTNEADHKLKSELLASVIEKNPFDVPESLIEAQSRALAQEWAQELKKQGANDQMIQQLITNELANLKKRAEGQVRASLILESIAKEENVTINPQEVESEITKLSGSMQVEEEKLRDYFAKNPARRDDLEFRLRQERTLKFLLDKAKID